ncbi:lamin tail domain-containing protein [Peribacillus asahii]|uniref:lamin tail domain-containing protein n=1 Tax=Peribacillus asahii TaxID=228899 RepID=UPI00207A55D0|nr:lamin tail domain-containing protein [Peribacillus asahii]USK71968.1 lamin tail domain-containing protein [Peribacillus asahii]
MNKKFFHFSFAAYIMLLLLFTSIPVEAKKLSGSQRNPTLFITELAVDTTNSATQDEYEFIELYNNSNKPVSFSHFKLFVEGVEWTFTENKTIPSQKAMVIWIKNKKNQSLTLDDFNKHYETNVSSKQLTTVKTNGLSNQSKQTLMVTDLEGKALSTATYHPKHINKNNGIHFQISINKKKMKVMQDEELATPGVLLTNQVPKEPVYFIDREAPVITHQPVNLIAAKEDLSIQAKVTDETNLKNVQLQYRMNKNDVWIESSMRKTGSSIYTAIISQETYSGKHVYYRILASDGTNTKKTKQYAVKVYDSQKVPELLVTELMPHSTNTGNFDAYQFIEIYNNTTKTINLKDYHIRYRFSLEGYNADLIWKPQKENLMLPSGETMVFWIMNAGNQDLTIADFNHHYGVNLTENVNIVQIHSVGMAYRDLRGIVLATNTGKEVSIAFYNQGNKKDVKKNKAILYSFPKKPGDLLMKKYSSRKKLGTPGGVSKRQVPSQKVIPVEDTLNPVIEDLSSYEAPLSEMKDLSLKFDIKDNHVVKTARLFYKNNNEKEFHAVDLTESFDDSLFHYTIDSTNLIGKHSLDYYVVASDGENETKTETKSIAIQQEEPQPGVRLNIKNNQILHDKVLIKAYDIDNFSQTRLLIDEQDVTDAASYTLVEPAYFAFDVKNVNLYFKNAVTIGKETFYTLDNIINKYKAVTIPIDTKFFQRGEKTVISIRSGTKVSPFDRHSEQNRDDFYIKNIRLVLKDGTVIYDPKYPDPTKELFIGDSKQARPVVNFAFSIPKNKYKAKMYSWDTTKVGEGTHTIEAINNGKSKKSTVIVDNSAPVIIPSIEEGKIYKGDIRLHAKTKDALSGVEIITAKLDGKDITLPYQISSAALTPGQHSFQIIAADRAGNKASKTVHFQVIEEKPDKPKVVSPLDGANHISLDPKLGVRVSDPTKDSLDVSFMKGYQYKANEQDKVVVYQNSVDHEPPKEMIPEGEKKVTALHALTDADSKYVTTKSTNQFPYQRFEITLDQKVNQNDEVELRWEGKSLIGRKVSMYVWNYEKSKWERKSWKIAENEENFKLQSIVKGSHYVKDQKVQVMIQDEIAATNQFDYSFIWMSDTQYYSASYPHIYKNMTEWIVAQRKALNIQYVFHTGDLVDRASESKQWAYADEYMRYLEHTKIPYGVLAGNHDVGHKTGDYHQFSKYFGANRFKNKNYYGESYQNNRGHYDLISVKGNDFIMLYMGWGVSNKDIAWINKVLAKYPERKAILSFHEYLLVTGERSPIGEKIYNDVVLPNKNVIAVLSGHYHDSETLINEIDDNQDGVIDRKVYQMLADYQGGPEGGQGFLRMMQVNPVENKIYIKTYSPYLNRYNYYNRKNYPGKDEFVMETDLTPKEKVVSTDLFEVNIYTDEKIGEVKDVANQQMAEMVWTGLEKNREYGWYVKVSDKYNGQTRSKVWTFRTNNP